jgi:multidrug resistance efflux pump
MRGVITSVTVNPGDTFGPDDALVTIMDETKVIVHAKIPLVAIHKVQIGQPVLIVPSADVSKRFTGIVTTIIPQADAQTDTFEVWVEIPNTNHLLLPGMSVYVHIQSPTKP